MNVFYNKLFYDYFKKFPIRLVDVGASGGLQRHWRRAEKFLEVVFFESDKRSYEKLVSENSKKKLVINAALYKTKGLVDFYLTVKPEVSSAFLPNDAFLKHFPEIERFKVCETQQVNVDSLVRCEFNYG